MYVISLSTIPPRFDALAEPLETLLAQQTRPEAVRLYIPRRYRRFPDYAGDLPRVPKGVEIVVVDEDMGPATKALFAARDLRGEDVDLLYCDDDRYYMPDWARRILAAREVRPNAVIASLGFDLNGLWREDADLSLQPRVRLRSKQADLRYHLARGRQKLAWLARGGVPYGLRAPRNRVKAAGFAHVAEGLGGVLIRPDWLSVAAWDIPPVMWAVDDVWLSGHLALAGHPVWVIANGTRFRTLAAHKTAALNSAVIDAVDRRAANRHCAAYFRESFGIWKA